MQILNNYNFNYGNYNRVNFEAKPKISGNQIKSTGSKRMLPKALAVIIPLCILAKMCNFTRKRSARSFFLFA